MTVFVLLKVKIHVCTFHELDFTLSMFFCG